MPKWLPWNDPPAQKNIHKHHREFFVRIRLNSCFVFPSPCVRDVVSSWPGRVCNLNGSDFQGCQLPTAVGRLRFLQPTAGKWLIKLTGWWLNQPNPSEKICAVVKIGNHHFLRYLGVKITQKYLKLAPSHGLSKLLVFFCWVKIIGPPQFGMFPFVSSNSIVHLFYGGLR